MNASLVASPGQWNVNLDGPEVKSGGHGPMDFPPVPRVLPLVLTASRGSERPLEMTNS